jgi:hypothetical protein
MNKQMKPDRSLLQFMLRAQQQLARQNAQSSDKGYVMMLTSIITILLFSMLGAYLTMTNLNKSAVAAYADGNNTFYAAESALNKRAAMVAAKFDNYGTPTGADLGKTADRINQCFKSTIGASPTAATAAVPANDFECLNFPSSSSSATNVTYQNTNSSTENSSSSWGGSGTITSKTDTSNYLAYTFVADTTAYKTAPVAPTIANPNGVPGTPNAIVVPADEDYAGLNALEYKYTVYATAAKNIPGTTQEEKVNNTDAKTVLQMDFKSRIIPLFQFAAFYDGDLEMHSGSAMDISGRVHTNSNLYVQPNGSAVTTFTDNITAAGGIFRRVDVALGGTTAGFVRLQLTPPVGAAPATFLNFPFADYSVATPIDLNAATLKTTTDGSAAIDMTAEQSGIFKKRVKDKATGILPLTVPNSGFLRKRNYYKSAAATNDREKQLAVGEYWAKADMRLELVPDRDAVGAGGNSLTATEGAAAISSGQAWTRNQAIIPFNFTSIQAGTSAGTSPCTVAPPDAGQDPATKYVDPYRGNLRDAAGAISLQCNVFTKGQLQSLRQPVMVLTSINQLDPTLQSTENTTLVRPALPPAPTLSPAASNDVTKNKILRALQVAIASTPEPLPLDLLNVNFSDTSTPNLNYAVGTNAGSFSVEFNRLLVLIPELSTDDRTLLGTTSSPNAIAALRNAWFLPAPVQRLSSNKDKTPAAGRTNTNIRSSGFYDSRERRWITMLQTNIKSLTVWNRDGLYVEADLTSGSENLRAPYTASTINKDLSFNSGAGANFTQGRAFIRATADPLQAAGSFRRLGLGATDPTEGGLVFHATVSDDLNGDGVLGDVTLSAIKEDSTFTDALNPDGTVKAIPYKRDSSGAIIYQKNTDGKDKLDSKGNKIPYTLDYFRKYWSGTERQSSFGFAFNGGDFLPAPMNIATDQGTYIQGDFNNNSQRQTQVTDATVFPPNPDRVAAAIMADTITILSNQCMTDSSLESATNHLGVLAGQIRCGLPRRRNGSIDLIQGGNTANFYGVTSPTAVNAAFLSNTDRSAGNCTNLTADKTYKCGTAVVNPTVRSGGVNNYIRMLEDWQVTGFAQYFNYSGSFVSLGTPVEYSGLWQNPIGFIGNGIRNGSTGTSIAPAYYNIPARNYNFDPKFSAYNSLPPMTPKVQYLQQQVFKRSFN